MAHAGATRAAWRTPGYWTRSGRALSDTGFIEGPNTIIVCRFADGHYQLIARMADELVASGGRHCGWPTAAALRPAKEATKKIPIVIGCRRPCRQLAWSPPGPAGGNITGSNVLRPLRSKQMELMVSAGARPSRIGVLNNPDHLHSVAHRSSGTSLAARSARRALRLTCKVSYGRPDRQRGLSELADERADEASSLTSDPFFIDHRRDR